MIISKKLDDLIFQVRQRAVYHVALCDSKGLELLITSTYRDFEAQHQLFTRGRSLIEDKWTIVDQDAVVTNADAGYSFHNFHCAYDVVPLIFGKPLWKARTSDGILVPEWRIVVDAGKDCGLEWAGDWKSFKEEAHFQYTGGLTLAQLREGQVIA